MADYAAAPLFRYGPTLLRDIVMLPAFAEATADKSEGFAIPFRFRVFTALEVLRFRCAFLIQPNYLFRSRHNPDYRQS
jgi:hypothetical protein